MRRLDAHGSTRAVEAPPRVSFEFFPPKNPQMENQLWDTVKALEPLLPQYVSVTYGAGGSTRDATFETVRRIAAKTHLRPAAHLTCVGHGRKDIAQLLERYWEAGVRHIVALRGDHPAGGGSTPPDGLAYAADLVAFIKTVADFEVSVAAYPETHPQAQSAEADLDNLKRKLDAGATRAITQYFFDPTSFLRFHERARRAGISVPIVPGILPVTNFAQVVRFSAMCGTAIPDWLTELFEGLDDEQDTRKLIAAMVATEQCRALQAEGITDFHFYTLNRADLILGICRRMGLKPAPLPDRDGFAEAPAPMQRDPEMPD
ncbi:methylenetetrahydrofolate reductase [NAD(P)H] [Rhodospirillaceae bacterium R-7]|uniref:Methylenetetrahydrofolate reductase n=1 Tax=Dongia sedimenti TaxID=3064282 RepID=A0ABU0YFK2_9PROT|nr:methylenetetrahydrofolate reductase [NAD(P)H] [Rhodospirillaceae bacterium R-7]